MGEADPATSASAAAAALRELPPALWEQVIELFRAALPRLRPSELPAAVRPFAGWHPAAGTVPVVPREVAPAAPARWHGWEHRAQAWLAGGHHGVQQGR